MKKILLEKFDKVAVWGVNYHSTDLFKHSDTLKQKNIFPIDISETKGKMDLYGKNIYTPDVINQHDIKVVVVAIPVYYTQIATQIEVKYKNVLEVIDICNLLDPGFFLNGNEDSKDFFIEFDKYVQYKNHALVTEGF